MIQIKQHSFQSFPDWTIAKPYSGISTHNINRVQLIENAVPRLRDDITSILAALHWLPVSFKCDFTACFQSLECSGSCQHPMSLNVV